MVAICKLGLEQANVFLLGTRGFSGDRLSGQNGLVAFAMGGLGLVLVLLSPSVLPALFADTSMVLMLLAGLTIPFSLHAQFSAGLLTLQGQVTWQFRASLLAGVVQVALLFGLFFSHWFHVGPVLAVNLATIALTWGLTVWMLDGGRTAWIRWDPVLLWDTLKQSLLLHLGMLLFFLHLRLDMFMVKAMVGTTALGQYSLSVVLAETVLLATDSLAIAILPRQMGTTLEDSASVALRGARTNGLLGMAVASLWAAAGIVVIRVFFGPAFAPAYLPLVGLLPGMVFLGMQRMCGAPALRAGRPGRITAIYGLSLLCNVALNLWWIPNWGPFGAGLASSISYGLGAVLFLAWTARLARAPLSEGMVPKISDALSLWRATVESIQVLQYTYFAKRQAP
jgi:O-antigen/teichoic acid export membrane protein